MNPYDIDRVAEAMRIATGMDPVERRHRMARLREVVVAHDVHDWAREALQGDAHLATV